MLFTPFMAGGAIINCNGPVFVPLVSLLHALAAVARGQLMLRLMLSLDITVIPIMVTLTMAMVTDMLSPDIASLMSIVGLERGQLRLMPYPDIMDITVIPMDFTVILTDTDTMLMDLVSLDTPVPLPLTFTPQVPLANKNAISGIP